MTVDLLDLQDVSARIFSPHFLSLFKGFTLSTVIPVVIIVVFTVIVVNILASLVADSPGPYPQFGKKMALTAANVWDNRIHYGFVNGRTMESLGPMESILDALSEAVKKWEDTPLYPAFPKVKKATTFIQGPVENHILHDAVAEGSHFIPETAYVLSSPQFITKPSAHFSGKLRFP